jgi:hypothetical protein
MPKMVLFDPHISMKRIRLSINDALHVVGLSFDVQLPSSRY